MSKNKYCLNLILLLLILLIIVLVIVKKISYVEKFTKKNDVKKFSDKQIKFKETLEDMKDILDKNNIPFFLSFGTALGAYREKKFIEHDEDIDIGIFDFDIKLEDIIKLFNNNNNNKFKINIMFPRNNKKKTEVGFIHKNTGVKIDIFEFTTKNNDYLTYTYEGLCKKKKNSRCEYVWKNGFKINNIKFLNKIYKIPEIQYIISHYGNDWNIVKKYNYFKSLDKKFRQNMI